MKNCDCEFACRKEISGSDTAPEGAACGRESVAGVPSPNKALVAAAGAVVTTLVSAYVTGDFNQEEFSIAVSGLVTAGLVYAIPYFKG